MNVPTLTIATLKLPVHDFPRARAYYRDTLGFAEQFAVDEYGWAQYDAGGVSLALYVPGMGGGDSQPGGNRDFLLRCETVAALTEYCDALAQRGADVGAGVGRGDDGTHGFQVRDPDGNTLHFVATGDAAGQ